MASRPGFAIPIVALCSLAPFAAACAQEKRIPRNQLPIAVRKTADAQARGAIVRGYTTEIENGRREYEVELTVDGHSRDVTIAPDGRLIEIEEQVAPAALPSAVLYSLRNQAGQGEIIRVESISKNGVIVAYEAQVHAASKRFEIQVGPNGEKLSHEE